MPFAVEPISAVLGLGLGLGTGLAVATLIAWLGWGRNRVSPLDHQKLMIENQNSARNNAAQDDKILGLETKIAALSHELLDCKTTLARQGAEKQALAETISHREQDLAVMEQKFSLKFENLANRIFEEKTTKFKLDAQTGLNQTLAPLKENLAAFQKKIDESFGVHAREQTTLQREIARIVAANEKMTLQAENLANALKGESKVQGNWGEMVLEKILEDSGLRKDIDYSVQGSGLALKHVDDGSALKPDVVVNLPDQRHIIIDSKVSLTHYERHFSEPDEAKKALYFNQFLASIREHVSGLATRRYQDAQQLRSLDIVLMFMPIEGALISALQRDPELHSFAWKQRIVIVCPSTLFATLRTIESMWRLDRQNKNAEKIATQGGALYEKIAGFVEDMEAIGIRIDATRKTYDEAFKKLSKGTGNILKRTNDIKMLGVKISKEIPDRLIDDTDDDAISDATDERILPLTAAN